jgi:hypothetical protein
MNPLHLFRPFCIKCDRLHPAEFADQLRPLEFVYHVWYRCRDCGAWWEVDVNLHTWGLNSNDTSLESNLEQL